MNNKFIIVGVILALVGLAFVMLTQQEEIETSSANIQDFDISVTNCIVSDSDFGEIQYSIKNNLDKDYELILALLQTNVDGEIFDLYEATIEIPAGQTIHEKQLITKSSTDSQCVIYIKFLREIP